MTLYRRFDAFDRWLHVALMVSFIGLGVTGLPLLFSQSGWASVLAHALGGFHIAGLLHRTSALVLIAVFAAHLARVGKRLVVDRDFGVLWGPSSMTPQPRDVIDLINHVKWFLGRGPRPRFDRYTYWEKFDYMAVFWGMGIIGGSGLMLWFPTVFARVLPGWVFNVASLIHGEEALLAVGFIFTIHFFNTHMRPEKFPMDPVIFTGRVSEEELREERPDEYERLRAGGRLEQLAVGPAPAWVLPAARVVAAVVLAIGFVVVAIIVVTLVTPIVLTLVAPIP
jgi:cytochrome b subunit of formate dehydrogenase